VLFGGSTFAIFAAIYYWFPKMFGRMLDERLGMIHFLLTFLFFNGTFYLMHIVGMHGHLRRIADPTVYSYLQGAGVTGMNQFISLNAFLLGFTQFIFAWNFLSSLVIGRPASENPWCANTLEWSVASPPIRHNFETLPVVYHAPYEYSVPGVEEDYLPQTKPLSAPVQLEPRPV
jgi:cytochrome c oxidase subunit 1